MRSVEKTGRTIEEAVESALAELGVRREDAIVEVLEEPSRGFLGILGGKDARVKVSAKKEKTELAREFLAGLLERMGTEASTEVLTRGDTVTLNIVGKDMGLIIGRRGETLRSVELLTNIASGKGAGRIRRVFVDASGYRRRRERDLEETARSVARRVERTGRKVLMDPMDARDRRIVHVTLQRVPGIQTRSEGEEPYRRVAVSLKESPGDKSR